MSEERYDGIAIIGMTGRFPGADSVEEFWANLVAGKESISFFSDEELVESGLDPVELKRRGHYVPARGVLKDADCFDAAFFGVHPKEAEVMDPQQRVFLEACWAALERAGYPPSQMRGSVGVFGGSTYNTYYQHALSRRPDLIELVGSDMVMFGNEKDYLTTRVAYKLGLKGPALNVSTACSTSLVAVCQACQSLLTYQCDVALAGGASVRVPQKSGYYHDEGNIGSSDGHTRTFDIQASGTAFGNGVAVVVLKRLEDAVKDGDQIYAVIKSAALNNDGSQRVSFGAPGVEGQSEVIAMAHALAGVDPESITCVEAHGTATPLGDPIELAGLTKAFRLGTAAKQFCALGSVKSNIGHLDAAAGVTGLIKMALSLHHRIIPPSLHFNKPNPKLDLENSPFYVNATLQEWKAKPGVPRRAGVSSFGSGGTNAHVVLEEAPELPPSGSSRPWQLLTISAKTPEALDRATSNLSAHLKHMARDLAGEEVSRELADAAFTLQTGRSGFVHRRIVACQDPAKGAAALDAGDPKRVFTHLQQLREPPVVFMFTGQGAQYPGMGAELYRTEPLFRAEIDRCTELLQPILGTDLRQIMFPAAGAEKESDALLVQTRFTQPALFVIEYALAKLWMSWGIKPSAMIGHSVGEYVAGCLAGVFSLEDALTLVARRGALVQAQPGGAMLAIRLPETEVLPLLGADVAIAAINSPNLCVASGPYEAIAALEKHLESKGVKVRHLHTSHAFHSPMMDPVLEPFTELLRQVKLQVPTIPYVSNVTARWITAEEAQAPEYWAGHVRQAVRFADGVAELMKDPRSVLLEVGPGQTLCTLARQHPAKLAEQTVLASLPLAGDQELRGLTETLGRLWMTGVAVDWQKFYANERRHRTVLPTYPFERKRYWPDTTQGAAKVASPVAVSATPVCEESVPVADSSAAVPPICTCATSMSSKAESSVPRKERLQAEVRGLMRDLSGYDLSNVDPSTDLLELGLDSLLLTQAALLIQRKFSVHVTFRQLMEELSSLDAIASHLDVILPADAFAAVPMAAVPTPIPTAVVSSTGGSVSSPTLEQLWQQQQQLTNQLLQLMGRQQASAPVLPAQALPAVPAPPKQEFKSHGPFKPIDRGTGMALSAEQSQFLNALIARYTNRTAGSKKLVAENRPILADPRSVGGFKQLWKEMVYPIVTIRSDGSRVWDVDGNEYVDFVMGFGASLFGHRPPFVVKAIHEQLDVGFEIGPIQPLAYEVAALMKEFTGMPRFAFTNTGSEAVLAATRVARTVSGRDKIAVFAGAYHGIFDEVLFRPLTVNGEMRTAAIAPGISNSALAQVIVLDYGNPQSLDILRARGGEIAAVLVEPVQSRRLDLQPKEFLHELRRVTQQTGTALIFDEVVTGFRLHPGGAQAHFGVRADLATYGKVIGGGMSVGVVAGDPKYMDALDGGQWQYGDTSFPEVGVTFFAGTFVRHPLALAAAKAVLTHLKKSGPELQQRLAERTEGLADQLRKVIGEFQAPYHLTQFTSLIQLGFPSEQKFAGLLFYLLRERGIHIWENRAFVMTTAHTEDDLAKLVTAFRESLADMRSGGFLAAPSDVTGKSSGNRDVDTPGRIERSAAVVAPGAPSNGFPLTDAQKEIWLAAQMGGEADVAYNESLKLEFRGAFDVDLFRRAVQQVIQRHPILLAKISPDGQWQSIGTSTKVEVPVIDLSDEADAKREQGLADILDREVSAPFDLMAGPLWRVKVVQLSKAHHVVVWTAHHIVCDGWSGGLLVSELAKIYSALTQGIAPGLETPVPFRDYVQTTQPNNPAAHDAIAYWRQQFAVLPPPLDLPTDHPRPLVRSAKAATLVKRLDNALCQSLKRTAGQQRTTMVVLLMAALKTLLHRLTGQTDLVIGLPVAGQAVTGNHCLVGHCVNLLPIRTHLRSEASFQDNLAAVKKSVLDAYDHHQCTIGTILQHISVPRSAGRPPLVEVMFNVDRDPTTAEFQGLAFTCERIPKRALHYDLFFNFVEGPHGLHVECDYNTDLFDAGTMERWLNRYQVMLESIAAKPSETLGILPLLPEEERRELVALGVQARVEFPHCTIPEWFEHQVAKAPEARAVTFEGSHVTYGELNLRANQLAHYLKGLGIGPEVLVGLLVERSIDMMVALLGILKVGGAYVPLDPSFPQDRLAYMVENSGMRVLVTHRNLEQQLSTRPPSVVRLDYDREAISKQPSENLASSKAAAENLAYVMYTSGSTGKPKGVEIPHSALVNFLTSMQREPGLRDTDTLVAVTTLSFDIAGLELYLPLVSGAKLVIASREEAQDPVRLIERMRDVDCTMMQATPATWRALVDAGWKGSATLKILCGGESFAPDLAQELLSRCAELWNMYGPTETTIWSTIHRVLSANGPIPIGLAIANTQLYVLDAHRNLMPRGAIGELYIGGDGLARGYFCRPELTGERFVPSPFAPRERLYRTGDLARWLPYGTLECLGRIDTQVKIRGYRIELGEVESVLGRHEAVRQCVVAAYEEAPGDKILVAYFEPNAGLAPVVGDLRAHLKKELPDYMVPSIFVTMEKLPLTPNGKIDRKALPPPHEMRVESAEEFVSPRDWLEQSLANIWSKVLRLGRVGLHDNFFELGGHSLLAVRIIVEIEKVYKKRLSLATLLQAPTIGDLASVLRKEQWTPSWSSLVPIRAGGSRPPLFLFHSHGGNVLEYYPLVDQLGVDQPVYAIQAIGLDGRILRNRSLEDMVSGYIDEIRSLQPEGPYFVGGFCFGGLAALEAAQQLSANGEEVAFVAMIQTTHPALTGFPSGMSRILRWWYGAKKRFDLERENFSYRGFSYLQERIRRNVDIGLARTAIAVDNLCGRNQQNLTSRSVAYILEVLGIEHDRAYERYVPCSYAGDVVLFRSEIQLPGLMADRSLGWQDTLGAKLEICNVPGHQQNALIKPHVSRLAKELRARLEFVEGRRAERAQGSSGSRL